MKNQLDMLKNKSKKFEQSHTRIIDTNIFNWFMIYALPALQNYSTDKQVKIEYEISDNDITVNITANSLLITDLNSDSKFRRILGLSTVLAINTNPDQTFTITLWFRGWKWIPKR